MATTTDTELLTEHFGYPPVSLLDDIINSINILAERALNSVEQGLLNASPASLGFRPPTHAPTLKPGKKPKKGESLPNAEEAHRHEIENGTHQLETLLCASIDRNFDKFEIYVMRNILCVRPEDRDWIRLGHYEGLDFSSPAKGDEKERPTMETVTHLRRRLQASQKLNVMLNAEKARNAALLAEVRRLVGSPKQSKSERQQQPAQQPAQQQSGDADTEMTDAPSATSTDKNDSKSPFTFLQQTSALSTSDASTPLTTTTAFTLSQLDALRSLSTSLRSLLPALSQPLPEPALTESLESEEGKKKKPFRVQRLEYIETATRKHLEQVRGLELGANGELRDGGEWVGDVGEVNGNGERIKRRRVEREEVEALEGVLGSLGEGSEVTGKGTGQEDAGKEEGEGEQRQSEEGREEQAQPEYQREGEGTTETERESPRRSRRSLGKQKAQEGGDGERMDES